MVKQPSTFFASKYFLRSLSIFALFIEQEERMEIQTANDERSKFVFIIILVTHFIIQDLQLFYSGNKTGVIFRMVVGNVFYEVVACFGIKGYIPCGVPVWLVATVKGAVLFIFGSFVFEGRYGVYKILNI